MLLQHFPAGWVYLHERDGFHPGAFEAHAKASYS